LSMIAGIGWPGLQQRALLLVFLVWLCIVANQLVTITATGTPAPNGSSKETDIVR
jgi:hypothetical protein